METLDSLCILLSDLCDLFRPLTFRQGSLGRAPRLNPLRPNSTHNTPWVRVLLTHPSGPKPLSRVASRHLGRCPYNPGTAASGTPSRPGSGLHEALSLPALLPEHILFFFASKYLICARYIKLHFYLNVLESDPAPYKTLGQKQGRDLSMWQMLSVRPEWLLLETWDKWGSDPECRLLILN